MKWTEEELRDCFYVFDSDGNGFIDMDELVTACKMLGCDDQQAEKLAQVNIKLPGETVLSNLKYHATAHSMRPGRHSTDWAMLTWQVIWGFHKCTKIGIIAKFVLPYIYSFLPYLNHVIVLNLTLDGTKYKRITSQGCSINWSCSLLMSQLN